MTVITNERCALAPEVSVRRRSATDGLKRVAAYCRVSTDMEIQQSSLETQIEAYQKIIDEHEGWVLADIYADKGLTGTIASKRPEFQRMIRDCEAGKIDYIMAKSISRFARNTVDTLNYTRELKNIGIGIYFEKEHLDTLTAASEMLLTIHAAFAQEESHSISENLKRGIRSRYKMGIPKWVKCYGYRNHEGTWEINEKEAVVVREIFDLYYKGKTLGKIVKMLNKKNVPSPSGKEWSQKTINYILHNEKYIGAVLMQKVYTVDHITHRCIKNKNGDVEQYYKEENHKPIIDREIYDTVQILSAMRDTGKGFNQYPYYGFLKCPYCNRPMVSIRLNNNLHERAWICSGEPGKKNLTERSKCEPFILKHSIVEDTICRMVKNMNFWDVPTEYTEQVKNFRNHFMIYKTSEYTQLRILVEEITFLDWNTMYIKWKWGTSCMENINYKSASDYPVYGEPIQEAPGVWKSNEYPVYRTASYKQGWQGKLKALQNIVIVDSGEFEANVPAVRRISDNKEAGDKA